MEAAQSSVAAAISATEMAIDWHYLPGHLVVISWVPGVAVVVQLGKLALASHAPA